MNATHTNVFYTDASNGWAMTTLDKDDFQIGHAEYNYRKVDAIKSAVSTNLTTHIFGRNGLFQRTLAVTS